MDITACVARRTRSRTEQHLNSLLRRSKGIVDDPVDDPPKETRKKRASVAGSSEPPKKKKRRRGMPRSKAVQQGVEFIGTARSNVKLEFVDLDEEDVSSNSVGLLGLNSKSDEGNRVSYFPDGDDVGNDVADGPNEVEIDDDKSFREKLQNASVDEVISLGSDDDEDCSKENESDNNMVESDGNFDDDHEDCDDEEEGVQSETSYTMDENSSSSDEESSGDSEDFCPEQEREKASIGKKGKTKKRSRNIDDVDRKKHEDSYTMRKDLEVFQVLFKSIWEKGEVLQGDDVSSDEQDTDQSTQEDPPGLNPNFGYEEPKTIEKSESEIELDKLWDEMEFALRSDEIDSAAVSKCAMIQVSGEQMDASGTEVNPAMLCSQGKHDLILDEEIGLKCYYCSFMATEIEYISPTMEKSRAGLTDKKRHFGEDDDSLFSRLQFQVSGAKSSLDSINHTKGSVWECIPGIKDTLYPHQQKGFEFIWRNLGGSIYLDELKSSDKSDNGGCVISHSPGTGKTRLTIVFLQAYLELFPSSHPVIIAPASLLLTWEEEFRKWNVNIPFYNMNSLEFSGKESMSAVSILEGNRRHRHNKKSIRMVKLYSWVTQKSILGLSYQLFEKLAAEKSLLDYKTKKGIGLRLDKEGRERQELRKILLEKPGLLVLDEGHTPRNQRSCIWKVLSRVQTKKRIILSGTPFQNNFLELSNILCLTRPAYADMISSRLKKLSKWSVKSKRGKIEEQAGIKELRDLMAPFVHVHKGSILKKSLPGLRDCVVVLNPQNLQKKILDNIDRSQNKFELEHKLSAVSVHPSLLLRCGVSAKEKSLVGQSLLEKLEGLKLESNEGVKTRFLIKFIRLSESINEKVLVFSQYLNTLSIVMEQLNLHFGWSEGREILFMHGKLKQKQRQSLINNFNDPNSKAKVFLASTKACSEGINLVGASRVVLLDVVWNPSVERQAISRAYRLGQKRIVYTYHLVIKGTPECDKYCKQSEKHRISELVFSSNSNKDKQNCSKVVSEDKVLDEMVWHDRLKDMFEKIIYQPKDSDLVDSFGSVAQ